MSRGEILREGVVEGKHAKRARTGQGAEMWTGYSRSLLIDSEMLEANRENNTLQWAKNIKKELKKNSNKFKMLTRQSRNVECLSKVVIF